MVGILGRFEGCCGPSGGLMGVEGYEQWGRGKPRLWTASPVPPLPPCAPVSVLHGHGAAFLTSGAGFSRAGPPRARGPALLTGG